MASQLLQKWRSSREQFGFRLTVTDTLSSRLTAAQPNSRPIPVLCRGWHSICRHGYTRCHQIVGQIALLPMCAYGNSIPDQTVWCALQRQHGPAAALRRRRWHGWLTSARVYQTATRRRYPEAHLQRRVQHLSAAFTRILSCWLGACLTRHSKLTCPYSGCVALGLTLYLMTLQ
jgi:hypothetical protein